MLNSIGGRDQSSAAAEPAVKAPVEAAGIGWMGYAGGALWATVICAAGGAAVLIAFGGG